MDIYEIIRTRRSVRAYRDDPVPAGVLQRVLDAARLAPSGSNRQPTRLILVREKEHRQELIPMCYQQQFIAEAPIVIVAVGKHIPRQRKDYIDDRFTLIDVAICIDHLTLAARSEGLGTCWIGAFDGEALDAHFKLPAGWHVVTLTPLGYPRGAGFGEPGERIPPAEFHCDERWTLKGV